MQFINILSRIKCWLFISALMFLSCNDKRINLKFVKEIEYNSKFPFYGPTAHFLFPDQQIYYQFFWKNRILYDSFNSKTQNLDSFDIHYVFVHSKDSIFCFNRYNGKSFLINPKGKILDNYSINLNHDDIPFSINGSSMRNFGFHNHKLYLSVFPRKSLNKPYAVNHEIEYDITKKQITNTFLQHPVNYQTKFNWGPRGNRYSKIVTSSGDLVYSFYKNKNLFVYSNDSILKVNCSKSKHDKNLQDGYFVKSFKSKDIIQFNIKQDFYSNLIYDSYRKLIFRVYMLKQELRNHNGKQNNMNKRAWSLMIYNDQFELIEELLFDNNIYNNNTISIGFEGIYIGKYNENNKAIYDLFSININDSLF